jgi:2-polyprenyl-6-methoxyphenol hydroxylase-like FAD-dependent oxidoreductase
LSAAGICGLSLALNLHARGIACRVYEVAPELKELGVGITLLPHAMREFTALGLGDELLAAGIENAESCFFNRFGQLIYKEPRGKAAGYQTPGSRHPPWHAASRALSRRTATHRPGLRRHQPALARRRAGRARRASAFKETTTGRRYRRSRRIS